MKTFYKDEICYFEFSVIDTNGDFVSDLSCTYEITKCSDGTIISSGIMTEINEIYSISYTFTELGEYRIKYFTPSGYENGMENIYIIEMQGLTEEQNNILRRILGLSQENYRIFSPIYDINNNMLSATIKTYNSASDCDNNLNPLAIYQVISTYDGQNKMLTYKVKKI